MVIKFWGTRGSIPVPGPDTIKYGGNTPCIEIKENADFIIIDAGTGIRNLGKELLSRNGDGNIVLLMTHTHWDHIQGLPFFIPLYKENRKIDIYSDSRLGKSIEHVFETQWDPNYFPVAADCFIDKLCYHRVNSGEKFEVKGFTCETLKTHHSSGTLSFKIRRNGKTVVYMTDNELYYDAKDCPVSSEKLSALNSEQLDFCRDADYLIHDCMYTKNDFKCKIGWGHSNNEALAYFAAMAKVKNLVLFHYDPEYSDKKVDNMIADTKEILKSVNSPVICSGAFDGLEIEV